MSLVEALADWLWVAVIPPPSTKVHGGAHGDCVEMVWELTVASRAWGRDTEDRRTARLYADEDGVVVSASHYYGPELAYREVKNHAFVYEQPDLLDRVAGVVRELLGRDPR